MTVTDQTGRSIQLSDSPLRIISLVPSQTELLHDLGLEEQVIGITKFCIHPATWFHSKARIGGTKTIDIEKIRTLAPTLIIGNKEENEKVQIEELANHYPVWLSDICCIDDALHMIESIGAICNRLAKAEELTKKIRAGFQALQPLKEVADVCYLIWRDPYMAAGNDTFIHSVMQSAGFNNLFNKLPRYPAVTLDDLSGNTGLPPCRLLLLSSEPYPFRMKHVDEISQALPGTVIQLVDGELFSWYGSRMLQTPSYLRQLRSNEAIATLID